MYSNLIQRLLALSLLAVMTTSAGASEYFIKMPTNVDSAKVPYTSLDEDGKQVYDARWVAVFGLQYAGVESYYPVQILRDEHGMEQCVRWLKLNAGENFSGHTVWYSNTERARYISAITQCLAVEALLSVHEIEAAEAIRQGLIPNEESLRLAMEGAEALMRPLHQGGMLHMLKRDVWFEESNFRKSDPEHQLLSHMHALVVMKRLSEIAKGEKHQERYSVYYRRGLETLMKYLPKYADGTQLSNLRGQRAFESSTQSIDAYHYSVCLKTLAKDEPSLNDWAERTAEYARVHMGPSKRQQLNREPLVISTPSYESPVNKLSLLDRLHANAVERTLRSYERSMIGKATPPVRTDNNGGLTPIQPITAANPSEVRPLTGDIKTLPAALALTDVATTARITQAPEMYEDYGIENALDGDSTNNYAAAQEAKPLPHIFTLELKETAKIHRCVITWESDQNYGRYYVVEFYNEDSGLVASKRVSSGRGKSQTVELDFPVNARHVRMTLLRTAGQSRMLLREFQVLAEVE
ncbi:MAG: hypothetical protein ACI9G1_001825 [Pirellulaceae bacterium]|jgi:hypothetical protein